MHVSLTTDASNERVEAKVVLGKTADEHFTQEGVASGGNSAAESRRALAQATLQAVNQLLQANYTFALDEIAVLTVGQREIILAVVSLLTPRNNEETLVGAVLQKGDSSASVVKAVLDAINRRFGKVALYPKPNVQSD
jgi:hypothetical protein